MRLVHSGMQWGIDMSERIFFSAKTNGFYPYSLINDYENADTWPEDAVEISERWYSVLLDGLSNGEVICANQDGQPVLSEPPPPTAQELKAINEERKSQLLREIAEEIAPLQDAVELGISTKDEEDSLLEWRRYRVLVNRVDPENPVWPERP